MYSSNDSLKPAVYVRCTQVLYRSGYGHKHNQTRVLKVKLPHAAVARLLSFCACRHGGRGTLGRVQVRRQKRDVVWHRSMRKRRGSRAGRSIVPFFPVGYGCDSAFAATRGI